MMFGEGLLGTLGDRHRKQRKLLNPIFSAAQMRNMSPTFRDVVHKLEKCLENQVKSGAQEIDMLSWMARTALEIVGQSGLGHSFDSMTEDAVPHPYIRSIKDLMPLLFKLNIPAAYILPWAVNIGSPRSRRFVVNVVCLFWKNAREMRDRCDFMWKVSEEIYEKKKTALAEGDETVSMQIGKGKDILSVLMRENMKAADEDKLDETELIGQMSTLIFAAMDTTSNGMARMLDLLSTHRDIQNKLRREVTEARKEAGRDLTYDELTALPYLDAVCRETLRLYPPVTQLSRVARQATVLPLSRPITGIDGTIIKEIHIPKNTTINVSISNANRNIEIWGPDAMEWKPERWLQPIPQKVVDSKMPGVYSHLMTFFGGNRSCIGFKFSQLEMKLVMSILLEKFEFLPTDKVTVWQMAAVSSPTVKGDTAHPQLPMRVRLIEREV
ncbi:hypothetical protein VKT23_005042 [Stygiomarasmius scandens]|uniref:Cytochrome P450 n=1 Tax=Marasmiellus scandens TaxID=2682957 RepID=A0ABR1JS00_9AGAR